MIFWFSGTGNSLHIARQIAQAQNDALVCIAKEMEKDELVYEMHDGELLGFVYPVYAWCPPQIVLDFIGRMRILGNKPYAFCVNSCGDEQGNATRVLQKALDKKGIGLSSAFCVRMPNNYIVGFDVDPIELEREKLKFAEDRLITINQTIRDRKNAMDLLPGSFATIKTALAAPLFNRFGRSTKRFYALDTCTRCGMCVRICPLHSILLSDKPKWAKQCTQCLACLHRCPVEAIQYGKSTVKKGRYVHPDLRIGFESDRTDCSDQRYY